MFGELSYVLLSFLNPPFPFINNSTSGRVSCRVLWKTTLGHFVARRILLKSRSAMRWSRVDRSLFQAFKHATPAEPQILPGSGSSELSGERVYTSHLQLNSIGDLLVGQ